MTINATELKFRQSQRMTDFSDGGGRMSSTVIVDNALNNVFTDRSDLDALQGRASLRKIYAEVNTANTDMFLGAMVFLTDPPADPLVSVCMFNTGSHTDERAQARNYVENYRVMGVKSQFTLYGDHYAGVRNVQLFCRPETASPDIGDVLVLSVERAGYTPEHQFLQVESIELRQTVVFTDNSGDFLRDVLLVRMTSPLRILFEGQEDPARISSSNAPPTVVRLSQVADAAKYYGMKPIIGSVSPGATEIDIGDPFIPIVPTSRAETPLVDLLAGLGTVSMVRSGAVGALTWSGTVSAPANGSVTRYLGSPFARNSVSMTMDGIALTDDGDGNVVPADPVNTGFAGAVDYQSGAVTLSRDIGLSGTLAITATPAGAVLEQGYTMSRMVTAANRSLSPVIQLPNLPARGTLFVDYRALGKWIRLRDNGAQQLVGNPGEGGGSLNYATGTLSPTFAALPDIDSAIIVSWGIDTRARNSSGEIEVPAPRYQQQLAHTHIRPGYLTMTWESGEVEKTAAAASDGTISGDATGRIDATAGLVFFTTSSLPDAGITYDYEYLDGTAHSEVFTPTAVAGEISIEVANGPIAEGSARVTFRQRHSAEPRLTRPRALNDDAAGYLKSYGSITGTAGEINYSAGQLAVTVE